MIKYIFALLAWMLMWLTEETGDLRIIFGAFASFIAYSILLYKELI